MATFNGLINVLHDQKKFPTRQPGSVDWTNEVGRIGIACDDTGRKCWAVYQPHADLTNSKVLPTARELKAFIDQFVV